MSEVARRHDLSPSLLFAWRRLARVRAAGPHLVLLPVQVTAERATAKPLPVAKRRRRTTGSKLERGRFLWPAPADGAVTISTAQLGYLLSGIDWRHPKATWRPTSVG